jgi:hypothetical protein
MQTMEQFRQELAMLAGNPAQQLAAQGRGGDSMLVHMRPDEVAAMQQMGQMAGTPMTRNPVTGLPEAFNLRKLFNINTYTDPIERGMKSIGLGGLYNTVSDVAQTAGQYAPMIVPFIPGAALSSVGLGSLASPMGRGILGGLAGTFGGGRPNLQRGLMAGLTSYGLSSAYQGLQSAGGGTGAEFEPTTRAYGLTPPPGAATETPTLQTIAPPPVRSEFDAATEGIKRLMSSDKAMAETAKTAFGKEFGMGKAYATMMGMTGMMAVDEQERALEAARAAGQIAESEYRRARARIDEAKRRAEEAVRANPYQFAIGGEIPLAMKAPPDNETNLYGMKSGGQARYLDGPGDGMSDSIPAVIADQKPARLADGEFVIPADVVSHLGNGSSKAGAKQLYAMMDRVRQARTGNKQQGKEITPAKYMPV